MAVYKKEEIPDHYHYRHNARIMPLIIEVKEGWTVMQNRNGSLMCAYFYFIRNSSTTNTCDNTLMSPMCLLICSYLMIMCLICSGKPWLQQQPSQHATCVRRPRTRFPPRLHQGVHALCRPLSSHVQHSWSQALAQQWLFVKRAGSLSGDVNPKTSGAAHAQRDFLRLGCGIHLRHRTCDRVSLYLCAAGDTKAATATASVQ